MKVIHRTCSQDHLNQCNIEYVTNWKKSYGGICCSTVCGFIKKIDDKTLFNSLMARFKNKSLKILDAMTIFRKQTN
jgi:hypothetical protein